MPRQKQALPPITWRDENVSRLILGTAQLGMPYGIANVHGQPDAHQARALIEAAWAGGIRHFDTAQAYGGSETVLGQALRDLGIAKEAQVTSKLAASMDLRNLDTVEASLEQTLQRLGVDRLWCMMLHRPQGLVYWDAGLGDLLERYRAAGRITHLGVSISPPEDAARCLAHPGMEIIQAPCNAWDRRLVEAGFFAQAAERATLICARSIYLQGLLTLPPEAVAEKLPAALSAARRWHALAADWNLPPVELALRHALSLEVPLVIGADTPGQLRETLDLARLTPLPPECAAELAEALGPLLDATILEPWRWPQG
jgi:aryl-alcohol dehydrogenase-like predicted oxidoreductase